MTGKPVAHVIMDALRELHPRAVHITELANLTDLTVEQVSGSLNNRLERSTGDVERVSRGVWRYVPPPPKTKSLRKSIPAKAEAATPPLPLPTERPKTLKVVGQTSQGGLLAIDPAGNSYSATRI